MSFARYARRAPFGYGARLLFVVNGEEVWGIASVVALVLERFARRYGPIRNGLAKRLELRLVEREARFPGTLSALRALEPDGAFHKYPKSLRAEELGWNAEEVGPFTPRSQWDELRREYARANEAAQFKRWLAWRKDEDNIRQCRALIRRIDKALK